MPFSHRTAVERAANRLATTRRGLDRRGVPLLDLTVSNPTGVGLPYEGERITRALADARSLRYAPEPFGLPEARQAVADELARDGLDVDPQRIVLTASTSEAYGYLFKLLCDPGDAVLAPQPSYPLFDMLARFDAVELAPYRLAYDGEWHLDRASLEVARTARCRAVLTVHPNNPTGSYLRAEELEALASLGLPIVSDEVFSSYVLQDDTPRVPSALVTDAVPVFGLGGLSKLAALPQMKLGWILVGGEEKAANEALGRLELVADAYLSTSSPVQLAVPELLAATRSTREAIRARTRENLSLLRQRLEAGSPVSLLRAEGGWYAVLRLPRTREEEDWCLALLAEDGVVVQPGYFYDFAEEAYVVVSLLTPPEAFDEGIDRLLKRVATHE